MILMSINIIVSNWFEFVKAISRLTAEGKLCKYQKLFWTFCVA